MSILPACLSRHLRWQSLTVPAALLLCTMGVSQPLYGGGPCYLMMTDTAGVMTFACLETPAYRIYVPRSYVDVLFGPAEIAIRVNAGLGGALERYAAGKQEGIRDDKQAVIQLLKTPKQYAPRSKNLSNPADRDYCLTSGLASPLLPPGDHWFPPLPGTTLTYAFADDSTPPDLRITDPEIQSALRDGLQQMSVLLREKLPRNAPALIPLPFGSRDAPSIILRLRRPAEFQRNTQQMRVVVKTKTPANSWNSGEILINPATLIYRDKNFQSLSIATFHEAGHVYGMGHSEKGVMEDSSTLDFDFFNFHGDFTCTAARLYIYYDQMGK